MKLLIACLAIIFISGCTQTHEGSTEYRQCLQVAALNDTGPARSGCCSWHGGVCGCSSSGRAACCDGSLSPSCGC